MLNRGNGGGNRDLVLDFLSLQLCSLSEPLRHLVLKRLYFLLTHFVVSIFN